MRGDWSDLRFKEQPDPPLIRLPKEHVEEVVPQEEDAHQPDAPLAITAEPAPDPRAEVIQALARNVYATLQTIRANPITGEINDSLVGMVPILVGLSQEQCDQFIDAFLVF